MESFGARLKREREQRKITLEDISVATKIGTRFLTALEEDRFDQLPGGIFNKGFVRSYARHLGINENQTIADFVAATEPLVPEVPRLGTPELAALAERVPESRIKAKSKDDGLPWGGFALALLVLAFGFAVWGYYSRDKSSRPVATVPPAAAESPGESTPTPAQPVDAQSPALEGTGPGTQSPSPAPVADSSAPGTPAVEPPDSVENAGEFLVMVKAREDSWVAITADGKQIVQDTLAAPAKKSIAARNKVVIKTGNVGALDISFNGKKLAPQGRVNQVKTLTFDPTGLKH